MVRANELEARIRISGKQDKSFKAATKAAQIAVKGIKATAVASTAALASVGVAAVATAKKSIDAAKEYEQAFAKTKTLLTGSEEQIKEVSDGIVALSNKTGIAASELTDTVYGAISAGIKQEDSVKFAETASKLAAGGFTEAATSVDVITTALNAYGLSADNAGKISDYLITTQNLGKTTVNELASSVGKVIPVASAYGVEMDNLSSAYAQLTKNGIATAEAGTYLKGMLNELGDSGSVVTEVLMQQTGKSFAELTKEGKSLGDVIDILGQSVNGDAGKFNELWSSTEAGIGALSIMNSGAASYNEILHSMQNSMGATDKAAETVNNTYEHQMKVIKNLGHNFLISVGQNILPIASKILSDVMPKLQKGMEKIMPVIEKIISRAGPKIESIMQKVVPELEQLLSFLISFRKMEFNALERIFPMLIDTVKKLLPIVRNLFIALQPVLESVMNFAFKIIPIVINVVNQLMPVVSQLISSLISALAPAINQIMIALQPVIENISNLVLALIPYFQVAIETLTPVIQYLAGVISTGLTQAFETAGPIITNFTNGLNAVVSFVKDIFAGNWRGAWEDVKKIFESTFGVIGGLAKVPLNAVISGINAVIGGLNSINVEIPDWVPGMGGENFGINIPLIPKLAKGGFTDGVSIAGEAGTEAVISFDPRYRNQNLENWAKAGRMLGASDGELLSLLDNAGSHSSGIIEYNVGGIEFKPQIIIQGNASKQDVVDAIREEESEFMDMLEEFFERRDDPVYG